jgi:outer membrane lipoprotein-sorting protein
MKSPEQDKKLDELISGAISRDEPQFDFDKWKAAHENEIRVYESQTADGRVSRSVQPFDIWRKIMRSPITKLSAAAAIIIAAIVGMFYFGGESVVLADVVKGVLTARTASFDVALESGNQPVQRSHFLYLSPGLIRQTLSDGTINIVDYGKNKALTLNPSDRTAKLKLLVPRQNIGASDILGQMQQRIEMAMNMSDKSVERLGHKLIDGKDAVGFQVRLSGEQDYVIGWQGRGTFTVWADPQTNSTVRLEWLDEAFGINTIATNIKLNVDVDEAMFSTEVPDGYVVKETEEEQTESQPGVVDEQRIINSLREWTDLSGGVFPSSVVGYSAIKDLDPNADISFIQKEWKGFHGFVHVNNLNMKEFLKVMQLIGTGGLIGSMPPGSDWHYAGKGVKLGQADKAIFWYRPAESETYRVIYGDLSIKDVAPENLPPKTF